MDFIILLFENATTVSREDIVVCVATEPKLTLSISGHKRPILNVLMSANAYSVIWFYCYTKAIITILNKVNKI